MMIKNHSCNTSSSQQSSQLLQKQHGMQQQQPTTTIRNKASSTNTASATNFANNGPVFSQSHTQFKGSNQTSHSKITGRTMDSHVNHSCSITSKTATAKNISQKKQGVLADGHMPWACKAFSKHHAEELISSRALHWCWILFMIKL